MSVLQYPFPVQIFRIPRLIRENCDPISNYNYTLKFDPIPDETVKQTWPFYSIYELCELIALSLISDSLVESLYPFPGYLFLVVCVNIIHAPFPDVKPYSPCKT